MNNEPNFQEIYNFGRTPCLKNDEGKFVPMDIAIDRVEWEAYHREQVKYLLPSFISQYHSVRMEVYKAIEYADEAVRQLKERQNNEQKKVINEINDNKATRN